MREDLLTLKFCKKEYTFLIILSFIYSFIFLTNYSKIYSKSSYLYIDKKSFVRKGTENLKIRNHELNNTWKVKTRETKNWKDEKQKAWRAGKVG